MSTSVNQLQIKQHENWLDDNVDAVKNGLIHRINPELALKRAIDIKNNTIELKNSYNSSQDPSVASLLLKTSHAINNISFAIDNNFFTNRPIDSPMTLSDAFMYLDMELDMETAVVLSSNNTPTNPPIAPLPPLITNNPDAPCNFNIKDNEYQSLHLLSQLHVYPPQISQQNLNDTNQTNNAHSLQQTTPNNLIYFPNDDILPNPHQQHPPHSKNKYPNHSLDQSRHNNTKLNKNGDRSVNVRRRRPNHPKQVTTALYAWYNLHKDNPYPDDRAKKILQQQTGLNAVQLNNWFINARRRYRNH